jgi:hypothetical protein
MTIIFLLKQKNYKPQLEKLELRNKTPINEQNKIKQIFSN